MIAPKGSLAARLEARPRRTFEVDLADLLGLEAPAPALVRMPRSGEDAEAIVAGHRYVERVTKPLGPDACAAARADADVLVDAKCRAGLAAAFRDPADPSKPLFPSDDWLPEHFSTEELAALANIVGEFRRVAARLPLPDDAGVELLLALLARLADEGHDSPGVVLAPYVREVITYVLVEAAVKLAAERAKVDSLQEELVAARARAAALEAELDGLRGDVPSAAASAADAPDAATEPDGADPV